MTENTPQASDTHPTLITIDGASMLADAASEHLRSLDAYKDFIRKHKPAPEFIRPKPRTGTRYSALRRT